MNGNSGNGNAENGNGPRKSNTTFLQKKQINRRTSRSELVLGVHFGAHLFFFL